MVWTMGSTSTLAMDRQQMRDMVAGRNANPEYPNLPFPIPVATYWLVDRVTARR